MIIGHFPFKMRVGVGEKAATGNSGCGKLMVVKCRATMNVIRSELARPMESLLELGQPGNENETPNDFGKERPLLCIPRQRRKTSTLQPNIVVVGVRKDLCQKKPSQGRKGWHLFKNDMKIRENSGLSSEDIWGQVWNSWIKRKKDSIYVVRYTKAILTTNDEICKVNQSFNF